jgi:hypothetical protein
MADKQPPCRLPNGVFRSSRVHLRDEPSRSEFGVTEAEVTGQPPVVSAAP